MGEVLLLAWQSAEWLLSKAADFMLGEHLARELLSGLAFWLVFAEVKGCTEVFPLSEESPHFWPVAPHLRGFNIQKKNSLGPLVSN